VVFGLGLVLGALLAIGLRAAIWWFVAFAASMVYAVVIPDWVDPLYEPSAPTADAAFNVIATGILVLAPWRTLLANAIGSSSDPTTCCTTSFPTRSPTGSRTSTP